MNADYLGRGIISIKNEKLLNASECALSRKISALQSDENEVLRDACAGEALPSAVPEPQRPERN